LECCLRCDVIEGMKPKKAKELFAKLKTDPQVFVCAEHRERAEFYVEQLARKSPMIFAEAKDVTTGEDANAVDQSNAGKFKSARD
jgi:glutaredoxin